ncbi:c2H2-type zinc-finger domain-containing protein [Ditylenchus destructor]|uniref:C2H2-type zinc-finger domain-containing protein n=1 Tax=Ditylenchus destructor TaxID=166010 RepID=A0AAD4QXW8_9BILA|nr:c2H2-type zinc-finger domain-containing protein [Ditylenchus destructor]
MSCQEQNLDNAKQSASLLERRGIRPLLVSNMIKNQKPIRDPKECKTKTDDTKSIAEERSEAIREKARTFSSQQQKAQQSLNLLHYERHVRSGAKEDKLMLCKLAMKNFQATQRHGNNLLGAIQEARKAQAEKFFIERAHPKYHRDAFFPKDAIVLAKWPTNTVFYKAFVVSTPSDQNEPYRVNFDLDIEDDFVDDFTSPEVPQMFVINYIEMAKGEKSDNAVARTSSNEDRETQSAVGVEAEKIFETKNNDSVLQGQLGGISELSTANVKSAIESLNDQINSVGNEYSTEPNSEKNEYPKNLQCESGNKVFAGRKSWNSRVSKHKKRQLHKCDQCPYIGKRSDHLKMHMRRHTGEKPFKCEQCSYASIQKAQLKNHIRAHHA